MTGSHEKKKLEKIAAKYGVWQQGWSRWHNAGDDALVTAEALFKQLMEAQSSCTAHSIRGNMRFDNAESYVGWVRCRNRHQVTTTRVVEPPTLVAFAHHSTNSVFVNLAVLLVTPSS